MSQIDLGRQGRDHTLGTPEFQDNTVPSSAIKFSTANASNGLVVLDNLGKLPELDASLLLNLPPAGDLATTGASVNILDAAPPSTGQVLTATNATHATWQTLTPGSSIFFVDLEIPSGAINNVNSLFALSNVPSPSGSLHLFLNGILQLGNGNDFTLVGNQVTMTFPLSSGSTILASYRH